MLPLWTVPALAVVVTLVVGELVLVNLTGDNGEQVVVVDSPPDGGTEDPLDDVGPADGGIEDPLDDDAPGNPADRGVTEDLAADGGQRRRCSH